MAGAVVAGCETVTVVVVELDRVEVNPGQRTLVEGETATFTAAALGPGGEALTGRNIVWFTSDPDVVTLSGGVGSQVTVTAVSTGEATLRASAEGKTGTARIDVLVGPSIVLSTQEAVIQGRQGEVGAGVDVGIANGGNGSVSGLSTRVSYGSSGPAGWLSVGLNGTTAPTSMTLVASGVGLPPGTYSATVRVSSPSGGGLAADLKVSFEVTPPPPAIALESDAVGLTSTFLNPIPATADVAVTNGGAGDLTGLAAEVSYPVGQPQGWLTATLSSTQAPATLRVSAVATGLQPGNYSARVAVTSPVARISPVFLDVTFRVALPGAPLRGGRERP